MPANFPEVWVKRVRILLLTLLVPSWAKGIPELDVNVSEVNGGSPGEFNEIHIPISEFDPQVLIDNTDYPIPDEAFTDTTATIKLSKYQTTATPLSDDQIIGAAYDIVDAATKGHTRSITRRKWAKALWNVAPPSNTVSTPIVTTTGAGVAAGSNQRMRFQYEDIAALTAAADAAEWPVENRKLVLSSDHKNDLSLDRKNFGDSFVNYKTGDPAPEILGWQVHFDLNAPLYNGTTKQPFGSAGGAGIYRGSVAFVDDIIATKTGLTKQYFDKADTKMQTNRVNYRHYHIFTRMKDKYVGAIVSGKTA